MEKEEKIIQYLKLSMGFLFGGTIIYLLNEILKQLCR